MLNPDDYEFQVAGVDIDEVKLREVLAIPAHHKFLVEAKKEEMLLRLFVCLAHSHAGVVKRFRPETGVQAENIVGGGICLLHENNQLVLGGTSGTFGAVPDAIANRFAELLHLHLRDVMKMDIQKATGIGNEYCLHEFWK